MSHLSWEEAEEREENDDGNDAGKLPSDFIPNCDKLKKDPNHHDKYLTIETVQKICESDVDHDPYANAIRSVKPYRWQELADSIVLVRIRKERKRKGRPREVCTFYGTGFLALTRIMIRPVKPGISERCRVVLTACHNVTADDKADNKLVKPEAVSVVFFHNGNDKECVTCKVVGIATMQSPPMRTSGSHDRKHLDYAILYVNVNERRSELRQKVDHKDTDANEKKITEKQIGGLANVQSIMFQDSALPQLLQMSHALPNVAGMILVCIGHPHGAPKRLSFGRVDCDPVEVLEKSFLKSKYIFINHTCITCKGFSGCPIFALPITETHLLREIPLFHQQQPHALFVHVKHDVAISAQSILPDVDHQFTTKTKINNHEGSCMNMFSECVNILDIVVINHFQVQESVWKYLTKYVKVLRKRYNKLKDEVDVHVPSCLVDIMECFILRLDQNEPLRVQYKPKGNGEHIPQASNLPNLETSIFSKHGKHNNPHAANHYMSACIADEISQASKCSKEDMYIFNCISGEQIPQAAENLKEFLNPQNMHKHAIHLSLLSKILLCAWEHHEETWVPIEKHIIPALIDMLSTCHPSAIRVLLGLLHIILLTYTRKYPESMELDKMNVIRQGVMRPLLKIITATHLTHCYGDAVHIMILIYNGLPPVPKHIIMNPIAIKSLKNLLHGDFPGWNCAVETLNAMILSSFEVEISGKDITRLVQLFQLHVGPRNRILDCAILSLLEYSCTHSAINRNAVFISGGIPRIKELLQTTLPFQRFALRLIVTITTDESEDVHLLLEAGIHILLLSYLADGVNVGLRKFKLDLSWVFGVFFLPPVFVRIVQDNAIMITLMKLLNASCKFGNADKVRQELIEGGVVDKIKRVVQRKEPASAIIAKAFEKTIFIAVE